MLYHTHYPVQKNASHRGHQPYSYLRGIYIASYRRPPRKNPAWTGVEHNDFGIDEFIIFCRESNTEHMIAANTGFGDAHSAAGWVDYCNSGADTTGGRYRIENGNIKPFNLRNKFQFLFRLTNFIAFFPLACYSFKAIY
jgi:hypothetical protein